MVTYNRLIKFLVATLLAITLTTANVTHAMSARNETPPRRVVNISGDSGGAIVKYALRVAKLRNARSIVRFSGRCDSACTLLLSLPKSQVCITPGATFRFHAPRHSNGRAAAAAKRYMLRKYPGWVRAFVNSQDGLTSRLVTMNYRYASRFIRKCSTKQARR
jgi:hypothetical protein